jgi:hypothetical protein
LRLEKILGIVLSTAGLTCLALGVFSVSRLLNVFIPNMEEATTNELASFFYVSTPQTILWSIAFVTFFASGMFLVTRTSGLTEEVDELSEVLRASGDPETDVEGQDSGGQVKSEADNRVLTIKAEVLKAIERLEKLDQSTD